MYARKATRILKNYILCLVGYVVLPYLFLGSEILLHEDPIDLLVDSNGNNISQDDVHHQILDFSHSKESTCNINILFAVVGASVGNDHWQTPYLYRYYIMRRLSPWKLYYAMVYLVC